MTKISTIFLFIFSLLSIDLFATKDPLRDYTGEGDVYSAFDYYVENGHTPEIKNFLESLKRESAKILDDQLQIEKMPEGLQNRIAAFIQFVISYTKTEEELNNLIRVLNQLKDIPEVSQFLEITHK